MKQLYFFLIFLALSVAHGQTIDFSDPAFKTALLASSAQVDIAQNQAGVFIKIDSNNDGEIQVAEANMVHSLKISNQNITNLNEISFFSNLGHLDCSANQLSNLNIASLIYLSRLYCSNNLLTSLEAAGLNLLNSIRCDNNQITTLSLQPGVWYSELILNNNQLSSLNLQNNVVMVLNCSYNQLSQLILANSTLLYILDCSHNELTSLEFPPGINFLESFNCSYNQISSLNFQSFINSLSWHSVDVSHNNLNTLLLGQNQKIDEFDCSFNNLTSLDEIKVYDANFSNNQFDSLSLKSLYVQNYGELNFSNNNLKSIFFKDAVVEFFDLANFNVINNPDLEYICATPNVIQEISDRLAEIGYENVEVNSYCSYTPSGTFYTISGNQSYNFNGSFCSTSDPIVPNLKFNITNGTVNRTIISDESGAYSITVQEGQHTITPVMPSSTYYTVSPASFVADFPTQTSPLTQNFCITANGTFPDIEVNLIPIGSARPGFDSFYKVLVKNVGTTVQSGTVSFAYDESVSDFIEATPTSPTTNAGSVSWTVSNLAPFSELEFFVTLNHNSPMETPALNSNDLLSFSANMQTAATDSAPDNNVSTLRQVVVNSFDPNDKTCLAGPTIGPEQVGKFVNYMIRFENTGTAAAQRVIVTDRIDTAKFDISTLTPVNSSHPFTTRIYDGNRVEFIFENIQLGFTDETNDGYVVFKIKTVPTLVVGDTFSNSAAIYFDFNYPIFTNDATTEVQVLGTENFDWQKSFAVFPNPMHDELTVKSLAETVATKIEVFNTLGQLVISVVQPSSEEIVDVSRLAAGNYFVKMHSSQGIGVAKVVKQ